MAGVTAPADPAVQAMVLDAYALMHKLARIHATKRNRIRRHVLVDPDDVAHDYCLHLLRKGHLQDPSRPFKPWAAACARTLHRWYVRQEIEVRGRRVGAVRSGEDPGGDGKRIFSAKPDRTPGPADEAAANDERAFVRRAIAACGRTYAALLRHVELDGLTEEATARKMGRTVAWVRWHYPKAWRRLEEELGAAPR